ncbi:hypothetical protein BP6252_13517 [Coleophoma cylindrospora]|uniref:Uncharacterized protein n=1 Tax=Coleophoma cylindrospora TaxID=1849047 RepID=A0A3D8Q8F8_9HELO|nr:hypothetical protein BP6252_13517 [Coleophoma cylindrospora]
MPGAFGLEFHQDAGSLPRVSGAKSHIFQPPRTPSSSAASSLYLSRSIEDRSIAGNRKRSRAEYATTTPVMDDWGSRSVEMTDPGSPMPFVNTKYKIAGGMDTPSWAAEAAVHDIEAEDLGYRRERSMNSKSYDFSDHDQSYFPNTDANGRPRVFSGVIQDGGTQGWNLTRMVGGVVGKVWEFCKTSAFRGFHAGGGKGYNMDTEYSAIQVREGDQFWEEKFDRSGTPIPGAWTSVDMEDLDFIPDYMDRATPEETPRPAKRRQVSTPKDELTKNWVVVPTNPPIAPTTPSKPQPRALARYRMPTASSTSRRLSNRGTSIPRPSIAHKPALQPRGSHAGSPSLQANKGASFASPRSPDGSRIPIQRSPSPKKIDSPAARAAAAEAQKYLARQRKEDREADESIRRLDRQLKAMIKEGKQALGTKITIEEPGNSRKWDF